MIGDLLDCNNIETVMNDKIKSMKNLQASFLMLSGKSNKAPMSSSYLFQDHIQPSRQLQADTAKLAKRYGHLYLKTDPNTPKDKEDKVNKQKINDYVKKIMFENQELSKKIRDVESINLTLADENRRLVLDYCGMKESYNKLSGKYADLIAEYGIDLQDKPSPKRFKTEGGEIDPQKQLFKEEVESEVDIDIFGRLFRNVGLESEKIVRSETPYFKIGNSDGNLDDRMGMLGIRKSQSREVWPQIELNRRNTGVTFRKSYSYCKVEASTQTESHDTIKKVESIMVYNPREQFTYSPSSKESELQMKVSYYEGLVKDLQKKNQEILVKYDRIKQIIGGEFKG